eukprot:4335222-Pyramimonas_sp.AAC.1
MNSTEQASCGPRCAPALKRTRSSLLGRAGAVSLLRRGSLPATPRGRRHWLTAGPSVEKGLRPSCSTVPVMELLWRES